MEHKKLFSGMVAMLAIATAGVFTLVHQGTLQTQEQDIQKASFAAYVSGIEDIEETVEGFEKQKNTDKTENYGGDFSANVKTQPVKESVSTKPEAEKKTTVLEDPKDSVPEEVFINNPEPVLVPDPVESVAPEITPKQPEETVKNPDPVSSPSPVSQNSKININTAGYDELLFITGVGPVISQRIIEYRNRNGLFKTIEAIKNVSGIAEAKFEKMKDEITVGDVVSPSPVAPSPAPAPEPSPQPNPTPTPAPSPEPTSPVEKININSATYEELQEITGVGEVIAQRIIDYREENGPFQTIEEIKNVKGIGDVTFEKMKDQITI